MLLQLTKNKGKPHVIKYIRDDGSETWMLADDFFIQHDLSHYAIENILGYTTAFNGMINSGMDIRDFENREKRKAIMVTAEAAYAENMANLFLMELVQGEVSDFNVLQMDTFKATNSEFKQIELPVDKISSIRKLLKELTDNWNRLPNGETLQLSFPL